MPLTFQTLIFEARKWINLATVSASLYSNKMFRLSKNTNLPADGSALTAWSIATLMSDNFSGEPMKRHLSVFSKEAPAVWVTASIKIIILVSTPELFKMLSIVLKGLLRVTYTPGMFSLSVSSLIISIFVFW